MGNFSFVFKLSLGYLVVRLSWIRTDGVTLGGGALVLFTDPRDWLNQGEEVSC